MEPLPLPLPLMACLFLCVCVCPCPTAPETSLCPQHRTGVPLGQSEELQPLSQHHPFLSHLGLASHPNGDWSQPCLTCDRAGRGGMAVCFFLPRNAGQLAGGCVSCQYSQLSPCVLWTSWSRLQKTQALSSSPPGAQVLVMLPSHCLMSLARSSARGLRGELLLGSGTGWLSMLSWVPMP